MNANDTNVIRMCLFVKAFAYRYSYTNNDRWCDPWLSRKGLIEL